MRVEIEGESPMDMEYSLGQDRMRLDMPQEVSVISTTGASPSMVMVQHAEQRYIEWSPQQLEMMRQMLQRVPGAGGAEPDIFDPTTMEFEETGQTAQIGNWNAFEVLMHGADGQEGTLWLSTEAEVGLFELSLRAAEAASMLQNPMTGGGGRLTTVLAIPFPRRGARTARRSRGENRVEPGRCRRHSHAHGHRNWTIAGRHVRAAGGIRANANALDPRIPGLT